jgi:tetratricopeptide (TPR) repeat protein
VSPQYYPLVFASLWVDYHLWGERPLGYHIVNVLLHAANAVLLWLILSRLSVPAAFWAAAVFALHPVHVESVAWIAERKNVLSGFFYLASVLAWFRFAPPEGPGSGSARRGCYAVVVALFLAALLSKTVTASLPAAIALVLWWKRGRLATREVAALLPLFVLGAAMGLMTAWLERYHVRAQGEEWTFSFVERCLIAGRVLWFYAGKLAWPLRLSFVYPRWVPDASAWPSYVFPVSAAAVVAVLWGWRGRWGRGPVTGVLFFAGTLVPVLGFFAVYPMRFSFVADHFQYLGSIGLIALGCASGAALLSRIRAGGGGRVAGAVGGAVLLALATATWNRVHVFRDSETLWRDAIAKNPSAWLAHTGLGVALFEQGRVEEAVACYEEALRYKPDCTEANINMGNALVRQGRLDEGIAFYRRALKSKPDSFQAHNNLAGALARAGRAGEAIAHFRQALRIHPRSAAAHNNLGLALAGAGQVDEAIVQYREALRLKPELAEAHNNLGQALGARGRIGLAMEHYAEALRLNPRLAEARRNMGTVLARLGRMPEAVVHYQLALSLKPDWPEALGDLAAVYARLGDLTNAVASARQGVERAEAAGDAVLGGRLREQLQAYEAAAGLSRGSAGSVLVPNAP